MLFLADVTTSIGANATSDLVYTVPSNEKFTITHVLQRATAAASIVQITDTSGKDFTNFSDSIDLPLEFIADVAGNNNGLYELPQPIVLEGGIQIRWRIKDLSGASNEVHILMGGNKEFRG